MNETKQKNIACALYIKCTRVLCVCMDQLFGKNKNKKRMRQAYLIDIWHMIVVVVVVIYHKTNSNIDIYSF